MGDLQAARAEFESAVESMIDDRAAEAPDADAWWLPRLSILDVDALFVASRIDWSTVDMSMDARLTRGSLHLRRYYPRAAGFLNLCAIDINDANYCVLGQLWGSYVHSMEDALLGRQFCKAHGFWPIETLGHGITEDGILLSEQWAAWIRDTRVVLEHQ